VLLASIRTAPAGPPAASGPGPCRQSGMPRGTRPPWSPLPLRPHPWSRSLSVTFQPFAVAYPVRGGTATRPRRHPAEPTMSCANRG